MGDHDSRIDKIFHSVGDDGRYQKILILIFLIPVNIIIPWTILVQIFQSSVPDHWCHVPGKPGSVTLEEWKNFTIPWVEDNGKKVLSKCEQFANISETVDELKNNKLIGCQNGWEFDTTWYDRTLPMDKSWVCGKDIYSTRWISMGMAGNFFGILIFSTLSDYWGRKIMTIIALQFYAIFAIARVYVISEFGLLAMMFLSSMSFPPTLEISLIYVMEQVPGKMRAQITAISFIMWTLGMCLVPLLAWLTRDWIILGLVTSIPFIPFFVYWWIFPESPRWLLSRGRVEESREAFARIAKINGKKCPEDLLKSLEAIAEDDKHIKKPLISYLSFIELLKYPVTRRRLILLAICLVCNALMYYCLLYNVTSISGNEFLNFFYLSICELPGNLGGWFCAQKFGRRFSEAGFFFLTSIMAALAIISSGTNPFVEIFVVVTCKTLVSVTFLVVYVQAAELLPTTHRAAGMGFSSMATSVVSISAPYIVYSNTYWKPLPYLIVVFIGLTGTIAALFLPETLGTSLPQTIAEAEAFLIDQPFWSYFGWNPFRRRTLHIESVVKNI